MKPGAVALIGALALLAASCGQPVVSTTSIPSTTSTTDARQAALSDGEHFAFVRSLDGDMITLDPAEMLFGEEAAQAAIEDGLIETGEDLPNDFYIRNHTVEALTLTTAVDAVVTLIVSTSEGLVDREYSIDGFRAAWNGELTETIYGLTPEFFPVVVNVEDGVVNAARQQYVP